MADNYIRGRNKKYNKRPTDPLYYQKYYDEVRKDKEAVVITCELCRRRIACGHIRRHQKSNICKSFTIYA